MTALLISIDRSSLPGSLPPLVLSGNDDGTALGVTNYTEPGRQSRVAYMPDSRDVDGSEPLSASWQQAMLSFDLITDSAADEAESRALLREVIAAVGQLSFETTVTIGNAAPEVWRCDAGSVLPTGPRTLEDLEGSDPEWSVTIPCKPTPGA